MRPRGPGGAGRPPREQDLHSGRSAREVRGRSRPDPRFSALSSATPRMAIQEFPESVPRRRRGSSTATAGSRASLPRSCGTAIWRCGSRTWRRSGPTRRSSTMSTSSVGAAPPPPSPRTRSGSETLACCSAASARRSLRTIFASFRDEPTAARGAASRRAIHSRGCCTSHCRAPFRRGAPGGDGGRRPSWRPTPRWLAGRQN